MTRSESLIAMVRMTAEQDRDTMDHGFLWWYALEMATEYEQAIKDALRLERTIHLMTKAPAPKFNSTTLDEVNARRGHD